MTMTLDTKGMICPLPILKAKKALKGLAAGEVLEVIATDPGAVKDFDSFCRTTGNELMDTADADGIFTFTIKKGA
ncbi:MAG: Sulfurtransferase TusA [Alphaproteobacteria bacterium MarineAlpha3_Bin2]|jgi:tRNA 2-thiouridine synthesizing protein A|nr:MAG: Sulfurtransferase TusA [Alphaproteobacteria bacterium MarineAlpha3_Bin1]PPR70956.1 MAG: Sulfurtransferase TusA [Alphaproteobacteria bacterium MarineAlpha3_Bin2]